MNGPLALGALGIFCLGVTLIAVDRQRWLEENLVGDALLPAGLAMVGVGILMVTISVGRRPATPRQEGSRADRGGHGCAYRRASHTRPNRSGALMSCRADKA